MTLQELAGVVPVHIHRGRPYFSGLGKFPIRCGAHLPRRYVGLCVQCWTERERWHTLGIGRHGKKVAGLVARQQRPRDAFITPASHPLYCPHAPCRRQSSHHRARCARAIALPSPVRQGGAGSWKHYDGA